MGVKKRVLEASDVALTFEDVLILPGQTEISPEDTCLSSTLFKGFESALPILSAPMVSVWSFELWKAMSSLGAISPMPTAGSLSEIEALVEKMDAWRLHLNKKRKELPLVLNISPYDLEKIKAITALKPIDYLIVDSVQPFSKKVFKAVEGLCEKRFEDKVIVGNVATKKAAEFFCQLPIAALKVGLGAGSICTTRMVNGVGVPQLSAIYEIKKIGLKNSVPIISDGGIRSLGDISKAFAAGADGVMLGRMFASTLESSSPLIMKGDKKYKEYKATYYPSLEGDFSQVPKSVQSFQEELKSKNHRFEGVSGLVSYSGPCQYVLLSIKKAVQNSMAFVGAKSLTKFQKQAEFIRVSRAGFEESKPHSLDILTERNIVF